MSQQNVDLVKSAYESFGNGDIPGLVATFDPNIEWISPAGQYRLGGVHKGPDAIVQNFFMVLGELWETLDVTPGEFIEAGDRVIVLGNVRGKGRVSGTIVESPYVHVFEVKNGKVTRFEEFEDTATINQAVAPVASSV
jgi:ketosteroid isomerase-like protein